MLHVPPLARRGFTLVEIMIVVAIIALLASVAVPNFLRARKRAQALRILEDLRAIDAGIDQYSLEFSRAGGTPVGWTDIQLYLRGRTALYESGGKDMLGGTFVIVAIDTPPKLATSSFIALSDTAPAEFWSPFR